jgi:tetratricopeptide (TPR) repeat protein
MLSAFFANFLSKARQTMLERAPMNPQLRALVSIIIFLGFSPLALKGNNETFVRQEAAGPGSLIKEAISAYKNKQYDQAISSFTGALALTSNYKTKSFIYAWRASAYIGKNQFKKAEDDANQAILLTPQNAGGYLQRASIYYHTGNFEKAIEYCTTAIRLDPNSAKAYFNRGASLCLKGEQERAIADYNEARRRDPNFPGIYYNLALSEKKLGRLDRAITDLDEAIRRKPTDAESYLMRGNAYATTGNYHAAASDLTEATRLFESDYSAFNSLAWLRATCPEASLRNGAEAVRMATKACAQTKWGKPSEIDTLAAAYAETGDFEQAVKYETLALKLPEPDAKVREHLQQHLSLFQDHKPYRSEPNVN